MGSDFNFMKNIFDDEVCIMIKGSLNNTFPYHIMAELDYLSFLH